MAFSNGAYATVWLVEAISDTLTKVKITTSRKNKSSGGYETDFSGFVGFLGTATAKKAACLNEKDRIKLGEVNVTNKYVKEKETTYTNFNCFSFEVMGDNNNTSSNNSPAPSTVDENTISDGDCPF